MKKDIVERLRRTVTQSIGYMGENEVSVSDLQLEAADEIERLRARLLTFQGTPACAEHFEGGPYA